MINEEEIRTNLLKGKATYEEGMQLYYEMTKREEPFPLELEEVILKLSLDKEPERLDLLTRLRYVLTTQNKPVPEHIEQSFAKHARKKEREIDFQSDAYDYHSRSDLKDMDEAFLPIYEKCRSYSMTSVERMYALHQAVNYLVDAGIEGDFVECGVWRGGSMMVVANALIEKKQTNRHLHLFDTYAGLPRPDEETDIDLWGNRAIDGWLPYRVDDEKSHWAEASEEEVRENLNTTKYPSAQLHFVKGMVEKTIPKHAPKKIALLRLDTDWYESTKHELECLYDRLSTNGILIIDDYGHFKGAKQAVDEFFAERNITVLLNRVDYTGRLVIKTD